MLYAVIFVTGIVFLAASVILYIQDRKLLQTGIRTTGRVIDIEEIKENDSSDKYKCIYEFYTNTNMKIVFEDAVSISIKTKKIGEIVSVVYDWQNPENARVISFLGLYGKSFFMLLIGLFLAFIGSRFFWE